MTPEGSQSIEKIEEPSVFDPRGVAENDAAIALAGQLPAMQAACIHIRTL
jgi:hypothetical protein